MKTFNSIEEIEDYIEFSTYNVSDEPLYCRHCGKVLVDSNGYTNYIHADDFDEDYFCDNDKCLKEYLIENALEK